MSSAVIPSRSHSVGGKWLLGQSPPSQKPNFWHSPAFQILDHPFGMIMSFGAAEAKLKRTTSNTFMLAMTDQRGCSSRQQVPQQQLVCSKKAHPRARILAAAGPKENLNGSSKQQGICR
jgi:hypothetical protein